ncbi:adenylate cyclase [Desulfobaculum xiamenense]|uniref:Adenylate cyclase n=1 Tax=Desulfobaculum xiamenense TaxID=995050 RepID=A0A846QI92_9BACT|nr:CHASE2 domain-containing protein [Desulfobaculum xiamenense]NJB66820.1 adenylate cyclase [Desulfobaculum xiamenense]
MAGRHGSFWSRLTGGRWIVFLTGVAFSILVSWLYIQQPFFLELLDYKLYDALLRSTHTTKTTNVPVIVDLDERSLAKYGQWPWPRYRVALLLARLQQAGALSVGLDILFAEPDRTSPKTLQNDLKRDLNVDVRFAGMPEALMDNDSVLAGVLGQGPYVLGYFFNFAGEMTQDVDVSKRCELHKLSRAVIRTPQAPEYTRFLTSAPSVVCNLPELTSAVNMSGYINTTTDPDGVVRRIPLLVHYQGEIYPNLSLATLMKASGVKQAAIKVGTTGIESIKIGATVIPVDREGRFLCNYRGGRHTFRYVSASKVLDGSLGKDELKGTIAFVGTSAAGLLDLRATPFDATLPGVEVHANVVDNILAKDFIHAPSWAKGTEFLLTLGAGLLTALLLTWAPALLSIIPVGACSVGIWYGAVWFMQEKGFYLSPLYSLIALSGNFALLTLVKFWREEGQKKFLHATFSSYLSPELINEMFENKQMPELGGEARTITAFFSDIQSFSTFSEKLSATQLVELLNEYLTAMTDILIQNRGTLDKYEGDAIVAFVGAPMEVPDHALRACRITVGMQASLVDLRRKWAGEKQLPEEPERNTKGFPADQWAPGDKWPKVVHEIKVRIGLNSGEIVVGNMGSTMRMNYTMMGDAVNLAARLESGAKQYGIYSMISEYVLEQPCMDENGKPATVRDMVEVRFIDTITVVGKAEPVRVYELCAMKGELTDKEKRLFELFDAGMAHYLAMRWDEAIEAFTRALEIERVPEGKTTPSQVYIGRCREYRENPPVPAGESWDGVYRMTKK